MLTIKTIREAFEEKWEAAMKPQTLEAGHMTEALMNALKETAYIGYLEGVNHGYNAGLSEGILYHKS